MKINHPSTNVNGTSLKGYVDASFETLVEVFGEPEFTPDDKTRAEWTLEDDEGVVATIYDYKMYGVDPSMVRDWHIGGRSARAVDLVERALHRHSVIIRHSGW